MTELSAQCSSCLEDSPLEKSFFITKMGKSLDVNRRVVYHFLQTGGGYEGLASFCSIMNMPCLLKPAYYQLVDTILNTLDLSSRGHESSWTRVQKQILKVNGVQTNDDVVDAVVSFDGTWEKGLHLSDWSCLCAVSGHWRSSRLPCLIQIPPNIHH